MSIGPLHPASAAASMLIPHGTSSPVPEPPEVRARGAADPRQVRLRNRLRFSATCAALVPFVVAVVALFTEDGSVRVVLMWFIALLAGAAVYTSATSDGASRRRTR